MDVLFGLCLIIAILLLAWAVARRSRTVPPIAESYEEFRVTPSMLYSEVINGKPDLASSTDTSVMLYKGWKTPNVELDMAKTSLALTVSQLKGNLVVMGNVYDLILTGNFVFEEFSLHPASGFIGSRGTNTFMYSGGGSKSALENLTRSNGNQCPGWKLQLRQARLIIDAHDIMSLSGSSGSPIIPEICKAARLTGISTSFDMDKGAITTVTIMVIPYNKPPLAVRIMFTNGSMFIMYARLDDDVSSSVSTIENSVASMFNKYSSSSHPDNLIQFNVGNLGDGSTTVRAEFVKGRLRVCLEQGMAKLAYYCNMNSMLNDPSLLDSHPLNPPQMVVTSSNAHDLIVLPFAIGDLSYL